MPHYTSVLWYSGFFIVCVATLSFLGALAEIIQDLFQSHQVRWKLICILPFLAACPTMFTYFAWDDTHDYINHLVSSVSRAVLRATVSALGHIYSHLGPLLWRFTQHIRLLDTGYYIICRMTVLVYLTATFIFSSLNALKAQITSLFHHSPPPNPTPGPPFIAVQPRQPQKPRTTHTEPYRRARFSDWEERVVWPPINYVHRQTPEDRHRAEAYYRTPYYPQDPDDDLIIQPILFNGLAPLEYRKYATEKKWQRLHANRLVSRLKSSRHRLIGPPLDVDDLILYTRRSDEQQSKAEASRDALEDGRSQHQMDVAPGVVNYDLPHQHQTTPNPDDVDDAAPEQDETTLPSDDVEDPLLRQDETMTTPESEQPEAHQQDETISASDGIDTNDQHDDLFTPSDDEADVEYPALPDQTNTSLEQSTEELAEQQETTALSQVVVEQCAEQPEMPPPSHIVGENTQEEAEIATASHHIAEDSAAEPETDAAPADVEMLDIAQGDETLAQFHQVTPDVQVTVRQADDRPMPPPPAHDPASMLRAFAALNEEGDRFAAQMTADYAAPAPVSAPQQPQRPMFVVAHPNLAPLARPDTASPVASFFAAASQPSDDGALYDPPTAMDLDESVEEAHPICDPSPVVLPRDDSLLQQAVKEIWSVVRGCIHDLPNKNPDTYLWAAYADEIFRYNSMLPSPMPADLNLGDSSDVKKTAEAVRELAVALPKHSGIINKDSILQMTQHLESYLYGYLLVRAPYVWQLRLRKPRELLNLSSIRTVPYSLLRHSKPVSLSGLTSDNASSEVVPRGMAGILFRLRPSWDDFVYGVESQESWPPASSDLSELKVAMETIRYVLVGCLNHFGASDESVFGAVREWKRSWGKLYGSHPEIYPDAVTPEWLEMVVKGEGKRGSGGVGDEMKGKRRRDD